MGTNLIICSPNMSVKPALIINEIQLEQPPKHMDEVSFLITHTCKPLLCKPKLVVVSLQAEDSEMGQDEWELEAKSEVDHKESLTSYRAIGWPISQF